jgi:hypothetical protein
MADTRAGCRGRPGSVPGEDRHRVHPEIYIMLGNETNTLELFQLTHFA